MAERQGILASGRQLFSARAASALVTLSSVAVLARILSREQLALLAYLEVLTVVLGTVRALGLPTMAIRAVPELLARGDLREARGLLWSATVPPIVFSLILIAACLPWASAVGHLLFRGSLDDAALRVIFLGAFLGSSSDLGALLLQAGQRFRTLSWSVTVSTFLGRVLSVLLAVAWGGIGAVIGVSIGFLVSAIWSLWELRDLWWWWPSRGWTAAAWRSRSYYLSGYARFFIGQGDQFIVSLLLPPAVLSSYYLVRKPLQYIPILFDSFMVPLSPRLAEMKGRAGAAMNEAARQVLTALLVAVVPMGLGFIALGEPLLRIFVGTLRPGDRTLYVILAGAVFLYPLYGGLVSFQYILKRPSLLLAAEICYGGSLLLLSLLLGTTGGAAGIALARALSAVAGIAFILVSLRGTVRFGIDRRSVLGATVASSAAMAASLALIRWFPGPATGAAVVAALSYALLAGVGTVSTLAPEMRVRLKQFLPPPIARWIPATVTSP